MGVMGGIGGAFFQFKVMKRNLRERIRGRARTSADEPDKNLKNLNRRVKNRMMRGRSADARLFKGACSP